MRKPTGIKYHPGSLGGRGRHPNDPTGEIYGDAHWPLPLPHEKGTAMHYMLIEKTDKAEGTRLLLVATMERVVLHGKLLRALGRDVIGPPLEGRGFAKLSLERLQYLLWNTWNKFPAASTGESKSFADLVAECLKLAKEMMLDETPLDLLKAEVAKLSPQPEDQIEKPAKKTSVKTPQKPCEPPIETSITGKVWAIADKVLSTFPDITADTDWKPIREAIITACVSAGIKASTSAAQYCRFKASKQARL